MTKPTWTSPPAMEIDPARTYRAALETSHGTIQIDLFAAQAPRTVNNFVFLARQGFFDGLTFHRVIPGFVIQGGDPKGTGAGDAGYEFEDELANDLDYRTGTLAMANAGPNTNGTQFFIVDGPRGEALPKNYSIFGRVSDGMDVVHSIAGVRTGQQDRPIDEVSIAKVTVSEA
jgi:peptidylprolyl isomerase/peptidyl-prolyl cis-trans isomerase B (cyclophilin B)